MYRSNHHWWKRLSVSRLNTELKQVIYYLIWLHQWVCLSDRRIFCCSSLNKITNWIFWGFQMSVRRCPKMSSGIFWDILWINSRLIEKIIQSQFRSITLTHSMKNTHSFKTQSVPRLAVAAVPTLFVEALGSLKQEVPNKNRKRK